MFSLYSLVPVLILFTQGDPSSPILQPGSEVEKVVSGCKFTEGPAVDAQGNLYFSDGPNDRIMKLTLDGKLEEFKKPCGRANGTMFDAQGRLVMCQSSGKGGKRSVARIEVDGSETVLAGEYEGKRFIAPNDLCIDNEGRIYFTDPYYGPPAEKSQPGSGVYRIDGPGKVVRVIDNLQRPNGILITPDNNTLYVSDRGTQKLHRYKVKSDGGLSADGIVYDFAPDRGIDGMCLDCEGNIYGAAGQGKTSGLFVISPAGKLLLHKPMPEFSTNVTFGGKDKKDLFLTASTSVYRMRTVNAGVRVPDFATQKTGKMHLYLLIGQSNMAGRGKVTEPDRKPHPRVFTLDKNDQWVAATDPIHFDKTIAGVGPGTNFGKVMADADPSVTIGLIPCAAGGSPISVWKQGAYFAATKSKPYDEAVRRVKIAMKTGELKGILWHQGESDSNAKNAPLYAERLAELIARLRKDLGSPEVPFLAGGLSDPLVAKNENAKIVDRALRDLPKKVANTEYVSSEGLKLGPDNVHFDADSARELGSRFAKTMRMVQEK